MSKFMIAMSVGVLMLLAATESQAVTLSCFGDSYTDEYVNNSKRNQHSNWVELLSANFSRSLIDFGTSKTVSNYPFNFAYSGATTGGVLSNQLPNLFKASGKQTPFYYSDYIVIDAGINDFHGFSSASPAVPKTYIDIGNGNAGVRQNTIDSALSNLSAMVSTIRAADPQKKIILANVPDWGATLPFRTASVDKAFNIDFRSTGGTANAALRSNVTAAVSQLNSELLEFAADLGIPVLDKFRLLNNALSSSVPFTSSKSIATSYNPDITGKQGGAFDFWADGLHMGTAMQGLYANSILAALNYYGESLSYLTPQQIINGYKKSKNTASGGFSSYWDFQSYVLTPGLTTGALTAAAIPEPGAGLICLLGAAISVMRRRGTLLRL
ncbi:MAG: SGNH/GDSL hydrolase family protein [Phycisphaeraceae bacterium]|nr:SGNH/GDSL hydrolase family protein [Phycisphaeraceae bacterium]